MSTIERFDLAKQHLEALRIGEIDPESLLIRHLEAVCLQLGLKAKGSPYQRKTYLPLIKSWLENEKDPKSAA